MVKTVPIYSSAGAMGQVNSQYAGNFQGFIRDLENSGFKVGTIGGYNYRTIAGTNTLSNHAFGNAIDINPFSGGNSPGSRSGEHGFPDKINEIAANNGLSWGGNWRNPDTMHFEVAKNASPMEAASNTNIPYDNFSQNGAMATPNNIDGSVTDPYGFSGANTNGFEMPAGSQMASDWGATFIDSKLGTGNPLSMTIRKLAGKKAGGTGGGSTTVPQAIDKQAALDSKTAKENTAAEIKNTNELYAKTGTSLADYITRIIFVVVGLVVFAAALRLFGGPKQIVQQVTRKLA